MGGGVFHSVGLFLLCFLTTAGSETVLPPENVRLDWVNGPELYWTPPKHSVENCRYQVNSTVKRLNLEEQWMSKVDKSPWNHFLPMDGGFLHVSIQTVCSNIWSEPVFITNNDTKIDLECLIFSSILTRCSWRLSAHTPPDLGFFYRLQDDMSDSLPPLQGCPSYTYTNNMTTGCELQMTPRQNIYILLNGTVNNRTIRNTFFKAIVNLRLQPLNWTVIKVAKDKFHISWTQPDFSYLTWKYIINYTGCDQTMVFIEENGLSKELDRNPECPYRMSMRAVLEYNTGETEWTQYKYFDADSDPSPVLFVVILIPLMLAVLAVLTLFCCMKNKEKIFPKIPQPPDYLSHILDNNNKISFFDLHAPEVEEECHVTLMLDTGLYKPQL